MKAVLLFRTLAASVGQSNTTPPPMLVPTAPQTMSVPATAASAPSPSTDGTVPTAGFPASRYETLWTKSPFAVATSEETTETSPDYKLVGLANIDGVSFASLIDQQNQEHFLISSDKPTRGLTLSSITRSQDGADTFAVVQKDGQPITLKLEIPPATLAMANSPVGGNGMVPQPMVPQISMPGGGQSPNGSVRPFPRFHRPLIHLPPQPGQQPQPPSAAPTPPSPQ